MTIWVLGTGLVAGGLVGSKDDVVALDWNPTWWFPDEVAAPDDVQPAEDDTVVIATGSVDPSAQVGIDRATRWAASSAAHRVTLCSSVAVYGAAPRWCPSSRPQPTSSYGRAKLKAEAHFLTAILLSGKSGLIVRLPGIFGDRRHRGGRLQQALWTAEPDRRPDVISALGAECLHASVAGAKLIDGVADALWPAGVRVANLRGRPLNEQLHLEAAVRPQDVPDVIDAARTLCTDAGCHIESLVPESVDA